MALAIASPVHAHSQAPIGILVLPVLLVPWVFGLFAFGLAGLRRHRERRQERGTSSEPYELEPIEELALTSFLGVAVPVGLGLVQLVAPNPVSLLGLTIWGFLAVPGSIVWSLWALTKASAMAREQADRSQR